VLADGTVIEDLLASDGNIALTHGTSSIPRDIQAGLLMLKNNAKNRSQLEEVKEEQDQQEENKESEEIKDESNESDEKDENQMFDENPFSSRLQDFSTPQIVS